MIKVQAMPFNVTDELQQIKQGRRNIGATAIFVGSVRDMSDGAHVAAMTLEHYPGMTERALGDIETEAHKRFDVSDTLIIHRYGKLAAGEDIVLVITCSAHREAAFQACEFLMDWLKTKAPFWKLEEGLDGANWVAEKASDEEATARWRT
jgi:molybdopterin synthase catalytic subunit